MPFETEQEAVEFIFRSRRKLDGEPRGLDEVTRDVTLTHRLLGALRLPEKPREYAVVTGSRGKGSTTAICAKLLQHLGHRVGMVTGPHLVSWRERVRINGKMIPQEDFLRILFDLKPEIDRLEATLIGKQYLSPQGVFLALALRWFDEQEVNAAVLEVGRGGRFDDIASAPNMLSLFTPIIIEHAQYLGSTLERIAWHKAGIIKPNSYAYSVPQMPEVLEMIRTEAEAKNAEFSWLSAADMGEFLEIVPGGIKMRLGRYGDVTVSLMGRYQTENASLAVQGVGNMHGRLDGISHGSPEYVARIRAGLADVSWPGRVYKLQDAPAVYIDGAITVESARLFVESVRPYLTRPVVTITGIPIDRDYRGVYEQFATISDALILTETDINPNTRFPDSETALAVANLFHQDVTYQPRLPAALETAFKRVGQEGTILLGASQMLVGEAMLIWGKPLEAI